MSNWDRRQFVNIYGGAQQHDIITFIFKYLVKDGLGDLYEVHFFLYDKQLQLSSLKLSFPVNKIIRFSFYIKEFGSTATEQDVLRESERFLLDNGYTFVHKYMEQSDPEPLDRITLNC